MKTDVTIVGAGLAGLIASIQFSQIGYNVACIDYKGEKDKKSDMRSTALLLPSINLLKTFGVWEQIKVNACPLQAMRIRDLSDEKTLLKLNFMPKRLVKNSLVITFQTKTYIITWSLF